MLITSLHNEKVKKLVKLRNRRERDKTGRFLIEGYRELLRAFEGGQPVEELYFCPSLFLGENENRLIEDLKKRGARGIECSSAVFHKISYRDRPDGLLGLAPIRKSSLEELEKALPLMKNPFLVVAEAIEKPGNLGTILRTADAVGADALIVADPCTDLYNPNVVRASVGTLFTVPVYTAEGGSLLACLQKHGIGVVSATPQAESRYTEFDFSRPVAVAFGTEQYGLSKKWLEESLHQVRIPMLGTADSLNVAASTAVLLYEVVRQRDGNSP